MSSGSVAYGVDVVCEITGAKHVTVDIPLPIQSSQQVRLVAVCLLLQLLILIGFRFFEVPISSLL